MAKKPDKEREKAIEHAKKNYSNWYDVIMHKAKPIERSKLIKK